MKAYRRRRGIAPLILNFGPRRRWLSSSSGRLALRNSPGIYFPGRWLGSRARLEVSKEGKNSWPYRIPNPAFPVHSLIAIQTTLIWLQLILIQLNYCLRYGVIKHFTLSSVQESHIPNLHKFKYTFNVRMQLNWILMLMGQVRPHYRLLETCLWTFVATTANAVHNGPELKHDFLPCH